MKIATFKLAKVSGGVMHYAEVTVDVTFSDVGPSVRVAPEAFAWLKECYGPNAWEWPVCEDYRAEAIGGATFALQHIPGQPEKPTIRVAVRRIHVHPAHTSPQDVRNATCMAVWKALGSDAELLPFPIANG